MFKKNRQSSFISWQVDGFLSDSPSHWLPHRKPLVAVETCLVCLITPRKNPFGPELCRSLNMSVVVCHFDSHVCLSYMQCKEWIWSNCIRIIKNWFSVHIPAPPKLLTQISRGGEYKMVWPLLKIALWFLRMVSIKLPGDPAIPLLDICPREMKIHVSTKTCSQMFIASFSIAKNGNSLNAYQQMNE